MERRKSRKGLREPNVSVKHKTSLTKIASGSPRVLHAQEAFSKLPSASGCKTFLQNCLFVSVAKNALRRLVEYPVPNAIALH